MVKVMVVEQFAIQPQKNTKALMEALTTFLPNETSYAVANNREFIYYKPSRVIDLKIKPGDEIRSGSATHKALTLRQKVFSYIDSSVFGKSYYGLGVPVIENGKPQGCVTAIFPIGTTIAYPKHLTVKNDDCWYPIAVDDIIYLEAVNRKAKIYSRDMSGMHKYNLSVLENLLPPDRFIRCHRSFIVNVDAIAEIQPDFHSTFLLIMENGDRVPVSQTFASSFRKFLLF